MEQQALLRAFVEQSCGKMANALMAAVCLPDGTGDHVLTTSKSEQLMRRASEDAARVCEQRRWERTSAEMARATKLREAALAHNSSPGPSEHGCVDDQVRFLMQEVQRCEEEIDWNSQLAEYHKAQQAWLSAQERWAEENVIRQHENSAAILSDLDFKIRHRLRDELLRTLDTTLSEAQAEVSQHNKLADTQLVSQGCTTLSIQEDRNKLLAVHAGRERHCKDTQDQLEQAQSKMEALRSHLCFPIDNLPSPILSLILVHLGRLQRVSSVSRQYRRAIRDCVTDNSLYNGHLPITWLNRGTAWPKCMYDISRTGAAAYRARTSGVFDVLRCEGGLIGKICADLELHLTAMTCAGKRDGIGFARVGYSHDDLTQPGTLHVRLKDGLVLVDGQPAKGSVVGPVSVGPVVDKTVVRFTVNTTTKQVVVRAMSPMGEERGLTVEWPTCPAVMHLVACLGSTGSSVTICPPSKNKT
eukprot:TRINITY_DN22219_c0_g1_i3.p1 TRINITY_DN22219_c0_g1~~TRINITY_DN22219_c0_g1_i3.p1  ORF type:complete len:471 (+),score=94.74 TRINITY_DN22219_c0_g1_i3:1-1413(+)